MKRESFVFESFKRESSSMASVIEGEAVAKFSSSSPLEIENGIHVDNVKQIFEPEGGVKVLSDMLEAHIRNQTRTPAEILVEAAETGDLPSSIMEATPVHMEAPTVDYFNSTGVEESLSGLMPGRNHTVPGPNPNHDEVTVWSVLNSMEGVVLMLVLFIAGQLGQG